MAQTIQQAAGTEADFEVLRPICMAGQRIEIGSVVRLTRTIGTEAMAAGKVRLWEAPKSSEKPAKAKPSKTVKETQLQEPAP